MHHSESSSIQPILYDFLNVNTRNATLRGRLSSLAVRGSLWKPADPWPGSAWRRKFSNGTEAMAFGIFSHGDWNMNMAISRGINMAILLEYWNMCIGMWLFIGALLFI